MAIEIYVVIKESEHKYRYSSATKEEKVKRCNSTQWRSHPIWKWFQPFVCQDTPEGEDGSEQVSQLGKERMLCPYVLLIILLGRNI
uniref:Uncharacterized protein n=1 Tax=Ditylenchus dipsaci TaxID=166011 RepID=A0A915CYS1_9BILA